MKYNLAIVGATGIVGNTTLSLLEERNFPVNQIYLLASKRSEGTTLEFRGKTIRVQAIEKFDFSQTQICFFSASNDIAASYIPKAVECGNIVIDKSSCYRLDPEVPLIIPEVNGQVLKNFRKKNIIANPNCTTIPIVLALKPIYDAAGITRVNIATYQSVSGSGKEGITELADQTAQLLNGKPIKPKYYPQQIAFNILPFIDAFEDNGYTKEELKIVYESQKILEDKTIAINPTAVRVPVFYGHSAAVHIETKNKLSGKNAIKVLNKAPGIKVMNGKHPYATPVDQTGTDEVFVGRIREDISSKCGLDLWVMADNIRKGASLNAIQIAEMLIEEYL